jgi:nucleotide-binding universal stress UspA family protein
MSTAQRSRDGDRPRRRALEYRRIAVCLAPGEASAKAVQVACTLTAERHAHMSVIAAIEVQLELSLEAPDAAVEAAAHDAVRAARAIAESYGVHAQGIVLHARDAGEAIVAELHQRQTEIAVIAANWPQKPRPGQLVGGTTDHVLKNAPCRVVLIGHPSGHVANAAGLRSEPAFYSNRASDYWPSGDFIDRS